jgi:primosomal protein N' (replication factor Y)
MRTATLFVEPIEPDERVESLPPGPYAAVAMEQSIDRMLDYAVPGSLVNDIRVGQRVRVPLGRKNRPAFGYVTGISPTTTYPKIKKLLKIEDDRVLVPPKLMELARWMGRYYVTPLGVVLESILPSAVRKRIGLAYRYMVRTAKSPVELQAILEKTRAPKRRAILARLLQLPNGEAIELVRLASEAGATAPTVRKLTRMGLITITPEMDMPNPADALPPVSIEPDIQLNDEQQKVFDDIRPRLTDGNFSVNLLMGVTGSGKTEVYLQAIRKVIEQGRTAIVLVPEIALTPQTVRRFTARFPDVAILHSGLTASNRHRYWQQILSGQSKVVVGARSAVFAPLPNVGIIVVDEEHESSYKQDQAPRYHARDVAIKRAQIEQIPVLLGSATPSLESYHRSQHTPAAGTRSANHLLVIANRVRGLNLPHIELVDMKQDSRFRRGVHLLSQRLEHLLRTTIESNRQAILLLNRRGYSSFIYCASCGNAQQCKYCDVTMTYHRSSGAAPGSASNAAGVHTGQMHCHYCLAVNPLPSSCPTCGKKLSLFGLGTQRVEEEIARKFPDLKYARVDSDTMRGSKDYEKLLDQFGRGEIQVMLGTQMIAKGLDFPSVTLVGVISGDTALALPDFRAAERTFQLITQVAGRAGRGDTPGRVVVQTFLPDDPTIRMALKQDYLGFAETELKDRREVGLPPFTRLARIILRDQDQPELHKIAQTVAEKLAAAIAESGGAVTMRGPMPCAIGRIAGYHRNQILLQSERAEPLQEVLRAARAAGAFSKAESVAVDVDPVALL